MFSFFNLSTVYGEHFQFPDTDPCEIVDIEATFHLSYEDNEGNREVGLTFTEQYLHFRSKPLMNLQIFATVYSLMKTQI